MIPKIIHQTWKTNKLPNILENIYKYNININNDYEYYMWSDDNSGKYLDNFIMNVDAESNFLYSKIDSQLFF